MHNEQQDVFSNQIRQKLEHYELPVDDRIWSEIKPKLHRKPSFFAFPWKIIYIVALVGGAGTFLFNAFDEETASFNDNKQYKEIVAAEPSAEKESINNNEYHHSVIENEILITKKDDDKRTSNNSNSTTLLQPAKGGFYPVSQQLQNTAKSPLEALDSVARQNQELEPEEDVEVKMLVDTLLDNELQTTVDTIDVLVLVYYKDKAKKIASKHAQRNRRNKK